MRTLCADILLLFMSFLLCVSGTYIRTSDGRIFAVRAANRAKTAEEGSATLPPNGETDELFQDLNFLTVPYYRFFPIFVASWTPV